MPVQQDYSDLPVKPTDPAANGKPPASPESPDALALFRRLRERVAQKPAYNKAEWTAVDSALTGALSQTVQVQPAAPQYLSENLIARALAAVQALPVDLQTGIYGNGAADFKRRALAALRNLTNGKG